MTIFQTILRWLGPVKQVADTDCKHCRGTGYDASGYTCTCVKGKP